jgi:hypothetical protein
MDNPFSTTINKLLEGKKTMQNMYQACIEECLKCMEICNSCYSACLQESDVKMMVECIRLDRECADICALAAKSMSSNSPFAKEICQLCAKICEACGNECKKHEHQHCKECADACFRCAEACKLMAS